MRVFVALDIDETIQVALADLQKNIRANANLEKGEAAWVKPALMHLTIKFLGEIEDEQLPQVCKIVEEIAARHKAFTVEVANVGTFGKPAKVLWVGIGENSRGLMSLQKDMQEHFAQAGWPKEEREFAGHLTLCRIKSFKAAKKLTQTAAQYAGVPLGSQKIDAICIYKSQLTPEGPVYTLLQKSELRTQNSE
ncbi:MAG: RNA 2',3'-cyclic phosphodiesterase [Sedimentisphaerales bacterium]|nr:RNA 2',3'-cyclic phosphodiesterase [Sedimentisphaerales bacterium]